MYQIAKIPVALTTDACYNTISLVAVVLGSSK